MSFGLVGVAVAVLVGLPILVDRWAAPRASPAGVVILAMVRLAGMLLAPLVLATCLAELVGHDHGLGLPTMSVALALGPFTVGRAAWATRRAEREWGRVGSALVAVGVPGPWGATVVPLEAPTAFVAGDRVVVSVALLDALDPAELQAGWSASGSPSAE